MSKSTFRPDSLVNFHYKISAFSILKEKLMSFIFSSITKKSLPLFLRGKDCISIQPQTIGAWEPQINFLVENLVQEGYKDFFVDIGANIGLSSCQIGKMFKEIHMFEPNPLAFQILSVNSQIALPSSKFFLYPFGLGESNEKVSLTVPKNNWGGAYINDNKNLYSKKILASKDGFNSLSNDNYFNVNIYIKNTAKELRSLFTKLKNKRFKKGIIKIDVEGYELTVLKGIAKSLPSDIELYIIFESLNSEIDCEALLNAFKNRATLAKVVRHLPYKKNWPNFFKFIALILKGSYQIKLEKVVDNDFSGDLILKIS